MRTLYQQETTKPKTLPPIHPQAVSALDLHPALLGPIRSSNLIAYALDPSETQKSSLLRY